MEIFQNRAWRPSPSEKPTTCASTPVSGKDILSQLIFTYRSPEIWRRQIQNCELWIQAYPREVLAHTLLAGLIYRSIGQYEKALEQGTEATRLDPNFIFGYSTRVFAYIALNRLDEAKVTYDQAIQRKLYSAFYPDALYSIAFLQNDTAGMARQVTLSAGKPGAEHRLLGLEADTAAYFGRLRAAREFAKPGRWIPPSGTKRQEAPQRTAPPPLYGKPCSAIWMKRGGLRPWRVPQNAKCNLTRR